MKRKIANNRNVVRLAAVSDEIQVGEQSCQCRTHGVFPNRWLPGSTHIHVHDVLGGGTDKLVGIAGIKRRPYTSKVVSTAFHPYAHSLMWP